LPINPCIIGPKCAWQWKVSILRIYCNSNNSCYALSLECETTFTQLLHSLLNRAFCYWWCLPDRRLTQGVLTYDIRAAFATDVTLFCCCRKHHDDWVFHCWMGRVVVLKDK
jgi:hypothetical protein